MTRETGRPLGMWVGFAMGVVWCLSATALLAEDADHDWQKDYPVGGSPALRIETGDSGLDVHSCGACRAIRIRVRTDGSLSRYTLAESQTGDQVTFSLREKPHVGIMNWHSRHTQVTVETPAKLELHARTSDGRAAIRGVEGELEVHTADGGVELDDVRGTLRVTSSDGGMTIRHAAGTLDARGNDGHIDVEGQFTAFQVHTSDGNLSFSLLPGSQLSTASRIESSDGHVTVRVPHDLAAALDVSTSDGRVDCALPLTVEHYSSRESSGHHVQGQLNQGTVPFSIHTSDGGVSIASL